MPKGYLALRVDESYRRALGRVLEKVEKKQTENVHGPADPVELLDLEVTIDVAIGKRSLKANALMWWLYDCEAKRMNAGEVGHRDQMVTPEDLYRDDMLEHGDTFIVTVLREHVEAIQGMGTLIKNTEEAGNGMVRVALVKTSSGWDPARMHQHIKMLFNRLAYTGGPGDASELAIWFLKWKQSVADAKVELYAFMMTREEYAAENPQCEACGVFIGHGRGHVDEIRTRGATGTTLTQKYAASDLLALCAKCHLGLEGVGKHSHGVETFAKRHKHLTEKIMSALRRAEAKT